MTPGRRKRHRFGAAVREDCGLRRQRPSANRDVSAGAAKVIMPSGWHIDPGTSLSNRILSEPPCSRHSKRDISLEIGGPLNQILMVRSWIGVVRMGGFTRITKFGGEL